MRGDQGADRDERDQRKHPGRGDMALGEVQEAAQEPAGEPQRRQGDPQPDREDEAADDLGKAASHSCHGMTSISRPSLSASTTTAATPPPTFCAAANLLASPPGRLVVAAGFAAAGRRVSLTGFAPPGQHQRRRRRRGFSASGFAAFALPGSFLAAGFFASGFLLLSAASFFLGTGCFAAASCLGRLGLGLLAVGFDSGLLSLASDGACARLRQGPSGASLPPAGGGFRSRRGLAASGPLRPRSDSAFSSSSGRLGTH